MPKQKPAKPPAGDTSQPWYADGVRFECQPDCGACCTNHDDYSYVYLEKHELRLLAEYLEMTPERFRRTHTTLDQGYRVLRMDQPACPFLDGAACSVYPVRPRQCRRFPFWEENMASPEAWNKLREFCPGIGSGPAHSLLTIRDHLDEDAQE